MKRSGQIKVSWMMTSRPWLSSVVLLLLVCSWSTLSHHSFRDLSVHFHPFYIYIIYNRSRITFLFLLFHEPGSIKWYINIKGWERLNFLFTFSFLVQILYYYMYLYIVWTKKKREWKKVQRSTFFLLSFRFIGPESYFLS